MRRREGRGILCRSQRSVVDGWRYKTCIRNGWTLRIGGRS
uniref:Uncharacterized protein n=1 Tax=Anopheles quadriannulatus TaxID=34691 RepID=A0A182XSC4_ANOQN